LFDRAREDKSCQRIKSNKVEVSKVAVKVGGSRLQAARVEDRAIKKAVDVRDSKGTRLVKASEAVRQTANTSRKGGELKLSSPLFTSR